MMYKASVKLKKDGYLIFSNNYYPGWKVYVDNKIADIEKAFGMYMGVKIHKGINNVIFKYAPENLKFYVLLNYIVIGFLFIFGFLSIYLLLTRRKQD